MQSLNRLKSERPRKKYDFYETPIELCKASLERLQDDEDVRGTLFSVLDAGAGHGVWGKAYREIYGIKDVLVGMEIQSIEKPAEYDYWIYADYLKFHGVWKDTQDYYGLIFGNPPYSLAEEFVRHSFTMIPDNQYIFFLLRLAFLESKKRHFGLFTDYPPKRVYVLSRRPSFFSSDGKRRTTDALSYAMFLWQNGWQGKTELDWLYWEYDE